MIKLTHCGNQSYPKVVIKVTNIKDINIKILCFFIHTFPHMFFVSKKMPKKWEFIFIYDKYIYFIHTWGNFDRLIKVTPSAIKVTLSAIKVTPFGRVTLIGLWFRISFKKLIIKLIKYFSRYKKVAFGVCGLRTSFRPVGTKRLTKP